MSPNVSIVDAKAYAFSLRIIKAYKFLTEEKREMVLAKQLLRCGTSIGANCREGLNAQSKPDFISKLSIALKEAGETEYWLSLLHDSDYFDDVAFDSIHADCVELIKILTAIIKTTKNNQVTQN